MTKVAPGHNRHKILKIISGHKAINLDDICALSEDLKGFDAQYLMQAMSDMTLNGLIFLAQRSKRRWDHVWSITEAGRKALADADANYKPPKEPEPAKEVKPSILDDLGIVPMTVVVSGTPVSVAATGGVRP